MSLLSSIVLPGQPIYLPPRAPVPQVSTGVYERDGRIRGAVIGVPRLEGPVRLPCRLGDPQ
jgi:exosome complex component CSL4